MPKSAATAVRGPGNTAPAATYRYLPAFIPLVISVCALVFVSQAIERQRTRSLQLQFRVQAAQIHTKIRERMNAYNQVLRGAAGLLTASRDVSRGDWHRYYESLNLDQDYRGIQGLAFVKLFSAAQLDQHVLAVRREGFPDYTVTPQAPPDQPRALYSSIVFIEPFAGRNLRAFGFDMLTERIRREAMERARDRGELTYSGPVRLVQETESDSAQAGVLIYHPMYGRGLAPHTLAQRRASLTGWTSLTFRMNDLMDTMLKGDLATMRLEVIDSDTGNHDAALLYDSEASRKRMGVLPPPLFSESMQMTLPGRTWLLRYSALPAFADANQGQPAWIGLSAVAVVGLLLCGLTWLWINTRQRAQVIAGGLTASLRETEERFRLMVEGVQDYAILMLDDQGTVVSWNPGAERIQGYKAEDIIGKSFTCFYPPMDVAKGKPQEALATALVQGRYKEEGWRVRRDGSRFWASTLITPLRDTKGRLRGFAKVTRDSTERRNNEESLRLAATVFSSTQEGVAITDPYGTIVAINPAFVTITEFTEEDVLGGNLRLLNSGRHDRLFFQTMWRDIQTTGFWQDEIWNRRKSGDIYPGWLTINAVRNERYEIVNYVSIFTDITRIRHSETRMEHLAHHDALTDLPNRLLLHSRLDHTLERMRRTGGLCAVMFLDLDRFKAVNDSLGHHAGDELLKSVAKRLRTHLRENDTLARLGGDEFVIVLEDLSSPDAATVVAQAVIDRLHQVFRLPEAREVQIGCSVGISLFPQDSDDADTLIQYADTALYQAKEAGRGTYRFYCLPPESESESES